MPLVAKSRDSVWRIWIGPTKVGPNKKVVGFNIGVNISTDKLSVNVNPEQLKELLLTEILRIVKKNIGE